MWYSCRASAARKGIKAVRKWHMHDLCNTRGGGCKPSVTQPSRTMGTPWTWNSASAIVSKKYTTHRQAAVLPSARRQHNGRNFWGTQLSSLWVFRKTALHPALDFALGNERKTHTQCHTRPCCQSTPLQALSDSARTRTPLKSKPPVRATAAFSASDAWASRKSPEVTGVPRRFG